MAKLAHIDEPCFFAAPILVAAMLSAVHHAEVIAHRIGEPYGMLVLGIAVTTIRKVLPNVTSTPGHNYSNAQLAFVAAVPPPLYLTFAGIR